jgi:aryl carrier-like protein
MPELTSKKFIEHPDYGRIYRSGDYGRLLPDGSLSFSGRRDDLVKLRGHRIELGEVNASILGNPAVKDCVTQIHEDGSGGRQQLISFWVPSEQSRDVLTDPEQLSSDTERLFELISSNLPAYMVPSFLVPIPYLPMTGAGKVDKSALLEGFSRLDDGSRDICAQRRAMLDEGNAFSETESKLAELISQVTGSSIADINRHSSLYRLGLDSISAISLSRKMKHAGFGQVDVSAIMRNDCVARLARILEFGTVSDPEPLGPQASNLSSLFNTEFSDDVKASANNSGRKVMKILPCTPLQEAMLLAQRTEPGAAYFNHLTFEVCADIPSLKNAWTAIVARHDILRTIFTPTNDARFSFAQVVLESVDLVWEELETSSTNNGAAVSLQESHIVQNENCLLGFVTSRDVDTGTTQLHIFIHHALYDGESMALLLHEVEQVLLCNPLPPVVPYDLYLEEMASTDVQQADRFWEGCLSQMSFDHLIVPQPLLERPEAREFDRTLAKPCR